MWRPDGRSKVALRDQYNNDEIILGYDAVPLTEPLYSSGSNPYQHCMIYLYFSASNVSTENQFLLVFGLRGLWGPAHAQFFVGGQEVGSEELDGDEQHAILLDCPDYGYVSVLVRLASSSHWAAMAFKGVDCYLL